MATQKTQTTSVNFWQTISIFASIAYLMYSLVLFVNNFTGGILEPTLIEQIHNDKGLACAIYIIWIPFALVTLTAAVKFRLEHDWNNSNELEFKTLKWTWALFLFGTAFNGMDSFVNWCALMPSLVAGIILTSTFFALLFSSFKKTYA